MKKIKILLADQDIRDLIECDHDLDIVAEAVNDTEIIEKIEISEPEIVILNLDAYAVNGIQTTRDITLHYPDLFIITLSVRNDLDIIKDAMLAGAKDFLLKPLSPEELSSAVKKVAKMSRKRRPENKEESGGEQASKNSRNNKLVCVYGTKGGVGKSVICANAAVAMGKRYSGSTALVDLDLQFGDIGVLMDLNPRKTIAEMVQEADDMGPELLEEYVYERNGVNILAPPNKPELADLVTPNGVANILDLCRERYACTFIDTPSFIDEITLTALEKSDIILLVISLDLPTIKNVKKGIDVLSSLRLLSRTILVLNRSTGVAGIEPADVERLLNMKIKAFVPSDGKLVVASVNRGVPFLKLNPRAAISKRINDLAYIIDAYKPVS